MKFVATAVTALLATVSAQQCTNSLNFKNNRNVNTFVFDEYSCSSDAEGKVFVGGDFRGFNGFTVGDRLSRTCDSCDDADFLVVGGKTDFSGGRVFQGDFVGLHPGETNTVMSAWVTNSFGLKKYYDRVAKKYIWVQNYIRHEQNRVDFDAAEIYYKAVSEKINQKPTGGDQTGTVTREGSPVNKVRLGRPTNNGQSVVFNDLTCADLGKLYFDFLPTDTSTVFINIAETTCDVRGASPKNLPKEAWPYVLYNFPTTTEINFWTFEFRGSVLAPAATINSRGGVMQGQIVANKFLGGTLGTGTTCMQQNHHPFKGCLPYVKVCYTDPWSEWSTCSSCQQTRNRAISSVSYNGGDPQNCPALEETQDCCTNTQCEAQDGSFVEEGGSGLDQCGSMCTCGEGGEWRDCCRVRQEFTSMLDEDRARFIETYMWIRSAANSNKAHVDKIIGAHSILFSQGIHSSPEFLTWHRWYILQIENELQKKDCRVTMPHWDWEQTPRITNSLVWQDAPHWLGATKSGCISSGPLAGLSRTVGGCVSRSISGGNAASAADVNNLINTRFPTPTEFNNFRNYLEHGPGLHDSVHCIISGTMCSGHAAEALEFFLHHTHIDAIWDEWQTKSQAHIDSFLPAGTLDTKMPAGIIGDDYANTPRELLDLRKQPDGVCAIYRQSNLALIVRAFVPGDGGSGGRRLLSPGTPGVSQSQKIDPTDATWWVGDNNGWNGLDWTSVQVQDRQDADVADNANRLDRSEFENLSTDALDALAGTKIMEFLPNADSIGLDDAEITLLAQGLTWELASKQTEDFSGHANPPPLTAPAGWDTLIAKVRTELEPTMTTTGTCKVPAIGDFANGFDLVEPPMDTRVELRGYYAHRCPAGSATPTTTHHCIMGAQGPEWETTPSACAAVDECPSDTSKLVPGVCGCGKVEDPTDSDSDGTPDCIDVCPTDPQKWLSEGDCGCGIPSSACNQGCLVEPVTGGLTAPPGGFGIRLNTDNYMVLFCPDHAATGGATKSVCQADGTWDPVPDCSC